MDADIAAAISIDWGSGGRETNDVVADLPAHAEPVVEEGERRRIFTALLDELNQVSGAASEPATPRRSRTPRTG